MTRKQRRTEAWILKMMFQKPATGHIETSLSCTIEHPHCIVSNRITPIEAPLQLEKTQKAYSSRAVDNYPSRNAIGMSEVCWFLGQM